MADLDTVKKEIGALLLTEKEGVVARSVNNLYSSIIGNDIPYKKFGFSNLSEFLHSLTDTLRLEKRRDGEWWAVPTVSAETAHIAELVKRQKVSGKKKRGRPARVTIPTVKRMYNRKTPNIARKPSYPLAESSSRTLPSQVNYQQSHQNNPGLLAKISSGSSTSSVSRKSGNAESKLGFDRHVSFENKNLSLNARQPMNMTSSPPINFSAQTVAQPIYVNKAKMDKQSSVKNIPKPSVSKKLLVDFVKQHNLGIVKFVLLGPPQEKTWQAKLTIGGKEWNSFNCPTQETAEEEASAKALKYLSQTITKAPKALKPGGVSDEELIEQIVKVSSRN